MENSTRLIAILNNEILTDGNFVNLISAVSQSTSVKVILLDNGNISTYPETWGEIQLIDAKKGLNKDIIETLEGSSKKSVVVVRNIRQEVEEAKRVEEERLERERLAAEEAAKVAEEEKRKAAEAERRVYLRAVGPSSLNEMIIEEDNLSPEVQKGIKYLIGDGLPHDGHRAYSIFKKAAKNSDDVLASYYYAVCIGLGFSDLGKEEGMQEALKAYTKAANQGYEAAIIGKAIILSDISDENDEEVMELFNSLKEKNAPKGLYYIGLMHELRERYSNALENYYEAAEAGLAEAQNALGYMYGEGWGVEIDDNKSHQWFELAAAQGLPQAKINLGMIFVGSGSPENIEIGLKMIREVAETGNKDALGVLQEIEQMMKQQKLEEQRRLRRQKNKEEAKKAMMGVLGTLGDGLKTIWDQASAASNDEYKRYD